MTILTSSAQLTAADVPDGDLSRGSEFEVAGIRVVVLPIGYSQKMGKVARIAAFARFMIASTYALLKLGEVDVVFATSTPLTVGFPALVRKWLRRTPFVFEVRDQWPAVPHQLGYLPGGPVLWLLQWFERRIYRSASAVVALSPGMCDGVRAAGGRQGDVILIPNCCDTDRFGHDLDRAAVRKARGWENRLVCLHVGAIGLSNGLDLVVRIAHRLRDEPEYLFVLVGDGGERPRLMEMADRLGVSDVEFAGPVPKSQVADVFAAADVLLVIFAPFPVLEHNSANKFFDSLSAGKPILLNYSGWQREIVESAGAGLGCSQGDEQAFLENLRYLKAHPERREQMGRNARELAETQFCRDKLAAQVLAKIQRVYRQPRSRKSIRG